MTEKYIDLADRIIGNVEACSDYDNGVADALHWLDEHPEAVPGRTITESQADRLWYDANNSIRDAWSSSLANEGITVVPDPEPTNAERLEALIDGHVSPGITPRSLAEWLDGYGVQAPKGAGQ